MPVEKIYDNIHPRTELFDNNDIEEIHNFATRITKVENRLGSVLDAHLNDLRRLVDENKALRISLTNLNSRISLINGENFISKAALNDITERLKEIKSSLYFEKKNAEILRINYEYLPIENLKLKEEKFKLIKELERLRLILKEQYLKKKSVSGTLDDKDIDDKTEEIFKFITLLQQDVYRKTSELTDLTQKSIDQDKIITKLHDAVVYNELKVNALTKQSKPNSPIVLAITESPDVAKLSKEIQPFRERGLTETKGWEGKVRASSYIRDENTFGFGQFEQLKQKNETLHKDNQPQSVSSTTDSTSSVLPPYCLMPVVHTHLGKTNKSLNEALDLPGFYNRYAKLEKDKIFIFNTNQTDTPFLTFPADRWHITVDYKNNVLILSDITDKLSGDCHLLFVDPLQNLKSWYSGVKKSGFNVYSDNKGSHEVLHRHEIQKFVKRYCAQTKKSDDQDDFNLLASKSSKPLVFQEKPKKIFPSTIERKQSSMEGSPHTDVSSLSSQKAEHPNYSFGGHRRIEPPDILHAQGIINVKQLFANSISSNKSSTVGGDACRMSLSPENKKTSLQEDIKNESVSKKNNERKKLDTTSSGFSSDKESIFLYKSSPSHSQLSNHFKNMKREDFSEFREILGSESDTSTSTLRVSDTPMDHMRDKKLVEPPKRQNRKSTVECKRSFNSKYSFPTTTKKIPSANCLNDIFMTQQQNPVILNADSHKTDTPVNLYKIGDMDYTKKKEIDKFSFKSTEPNVNVVSHSPSDKINLKQKSTFTQSSDTTSSYPSYLKPYVKEVKENTHKKTNYSLKTSVPVSENTSSQKNKNLDEKHKKHVSRLKEKRSDSSDSSVRSVSLLESTHATPSETLRVRRLMKKHDKLAGNKSVSDTSEGESSKSSNDGVIYTKNGTKNKFRFVFIFNDGSQTGVGNLASSSQLQKKKIPDLKTSVDFLDKPSKDYETCFLSINIPNRNVLEEIQNNKIPKNKCDVSVQQHSMFSRDSLQIISNDSELNSHLSNTKDLKKDTLTQTDLTSDQRHSVKLLDKNTMTSKNNIMMEPFQQAILCHLNCPTGLSPTKTLLPKTFDKVRLLLNPQASTVTLQRNVISDFDTFETDDLTWSYDNKEKHFTIFYDTYNDSEPNQLNYLKLCPYTKEDYQSVLDTFKKMNWKKVTRQNTDTKMSSKVVMKTPSDQRGVVAKANVPTKPKLSTVPYISKNTNVDNTTDQHVTQDADSQETEKLTELAFEPHDCVFSINPQDNEITLTRNAGDRDEETFTFKTDNEASFEATKSDLIKNSFVLSEQSEQGKLVPNLPTRQVCIVEKGRIKLYKRYINEHQEPSFEFHADEYWGVTNAVRKEIFICHMNPDGTVNKKLIDCFSNQVWKRWYTALLFGGFIRDMTPDDEEKLKSLNLLVRYVFPIRFFNFQEYKNNPSVRVTEDGIHIYALPDDKKPSMVFLKKDIQIFSDLTNRRFRLFRYRYTPREEQCDILLNLTRDFDIIFADLEKYNFLANNVCPMIGEKTKSTTQLIHARKFVLDVYPVPETSKPRFSLSAFDYIAEIKYKESCIEITIRPRNTSEELQTAAALEKIAAGYKVKTPSERLSLPTFSFSLTNNLSLDTWRFAFFVTQLEVSPKDTPELFLPFIFYKFFTNDFPNTTGKQKNQWFLFGHSQTKKKAEDTKQIHKKSQRELRKKEKILKQEAKSFPYEDVLVTQ